MAREESGRCGVGRGASGDGEGDGEGGRVKRGAGDGEDGGSIGLRRVEETNDGEGGRAEGVKDGVICLARVAVWAGEITGAPGRSGEAEALSPPPRDQLPVPPALEPTSLPAGGKAGDPPPRPADQVAACAAYDLAPAPASGPAFCAWRGEGGPQLMRLLLLGLSKGEG